MNSLFSRIVSGEIPSHKVAENDDFLAFLDIMPVQLGHVLVIPKKETDFIFDMDDSDLSAMILFAKELAQKMKLVFDCKKIGVTVIGLEVPHAHIHLIPINSLSDMDFTKPKLVVSSDKLNEIAKLIKG
jgi:histidine triad (HIT) family protein